MSSLAASIRELGVLQPILVREVDGEAESYELIAGSGAGGRRAGPAFRPSRSLSRRPRATSTASNRHLSRNPRADLNALEEAAAYQQLIDEFEFTHEQVATRVGKSRTAVTNTLRLLQLPSGAQRALARTPSLRATPVPSSGPRPGPPRAPGRADHRRGLDRAGARGVRPWGEWSPS